MGEKIGNFVKCWFEWKNFRLDKERRAARVVARADVTGGTKDAGGGETGNSTAISLKLLVIITKAARWVTSDNSMKWQKVKSLHRCVSQWRCCRTKGGAI